jgi:hypothetical protein
VRLLRHDLVPHRIDLQRNVGHFLAIDARAGEQDRFGRVDLAVIAHVFPMGVPGNDEVDAGVQPVEDRLDIAHQIIAAIGIGRALGLAAFVDQHDDGVRPCALSCGTAALIVSASSANVTPPSGLTRSTVPFSVRPITPIVTLRLPSPKLLSPWRKQRIAAGILGACREVAECGAGERFELAGLLGRELLAAPVLHPPQFAGAAIEFVVAHRVEIDADAIHHADGRLVEIERGG